MEVFHELGAVRNEIGPSAVAIGNFDGCHLGHQKIIESMGQYANDHRLAKAVLTFYPHPVEVLRPGTKLFRLATASEKLAYFENLGVHFVYVLQFNANIANLSAEDFFERYLVDGLKAASIHVGFNFKFGKDRLGDTQLLEKFCKRRHTHLSVVPKFEVGGQVVSSSVIRKEVQSGNFPAVETLLGRPYSVTGQVVGGNQRGRVLGFPTANLKVPGEKIVPSLGVYMTEAVWQKQVFLSVTNVGRRPTFEKGDTDPIFETHILNFNQQIYDEFVELRFLRKIRDEKKFSSVDELREQIGKDVEATRRWAEEKGP